MIGLNSPINDCTPWYKFVLQILGTLIPAVWAAIELNRKLRKEYTKTDGDSVAD